LLNAGTVRNSVVWNNFAQTIAGAAVLVSYSDVQNWSGPGEGNISADPLLAPDLSLLPESPCIDSGSNSFAPAMPYDLVGGCRVTDGDSNGSAIVDMGAREVQTCPANCDCSSAAPLLTVLDFLCFINRFGSGAAGNGWDAFYANCDASTVAPVLNVLDFNCFLNRFTAGCP
jgi:hypothetical protein